MTVTQDYTNERKKESYSVRDVEVTVTRAVVSGCIVVVCCACTEKQCSLLSDLLHELVELAQSNDDNRCSDVVMEAACCLGVIGVIDIGLVRRRGRPANVELESALSAMRDSAKMQQYCHMFHALADCLTDSQLVLLWSYEQIGVV